MPNSHENRSKILYNCYFAECRETEQFIPEHIFSFQLAGTLIVNDGEKSTVFEAGTFRFARRNRLVNFIKQPQENGEFKSISVFIDQQTLMTISKEYDLKPDQDSITENTFISLKTHPMYESFIESLLVYLQLPEDEQQAMMSIKLREAVQLLITVNPELKNILFDFSDPGKIDLEAFMLKNFHFNAGLKHFAYLSGRSLSTFKRDFEKIFHTTPSRWLTRQRLQEAHYLIQQKGKAPSEVYFEVGFEDLSHFSFAFKKQFGIAPSKLATIQVGNVLNFKDLKEMPEK